MVVHSFARTLQRADEPTRAIFAEAWHRADLDRLIPLDELQRQLAEPPTDA
jgi:hypothetical protein